MCMHTRGERNRSQKYRFSKILSTRLSLILVKSLEEKNKMHIAERMYHGSNMYFSFHSQTRFVNSSLLKSTLLIPSDASIFSTTNWENHEKEKAY